MIAICARCGTSNPVNEGSTAWMCKVCSAKHRISIEVPKVEEKIIEVPKIEEVKIEETEVEEKILEDSNYSKSVIKGKIFGKKVIEESV